VAAFDSDNPPLPLEPGTGVVYLILLFPSFLSSPYFLPLCPAGETSNPIADEHQAIVDLFFMTTSYPSTACTVTLP
jgi:hypothetical protein